MAEVYRLLALVAASDMSVLVVGETGVGKEHLAEHVHRCSLRRQGPLVRINCAALSESLLESELFGHEKGAFTGAIQAKPGVFEAAHGGSLFLDEIGELSPATQAKLLRVLETHEVTRVGSHRPIAVDVRLVSATNRDVRSMVGNGTFRMDLYYRINGMTVEVPPLRARPGDILPLARYFGLRYATGLGRSQPVLSEATAELLLAHRWPGNVRELKSAIERAVLFMADGTIHPTDLSLENLSLLPKDTEFPEAEATTPRGDIEAARRQLREAERQRILAALEQTGSQARAANLLGMSRGKLMYKLDELGIPRPRKSAPPPSRADT